MLIIDKPAGLPVHAGPGGLPVHAGPGGGPNLESLFDALRFGLPQPPALAHRLDRETSGCLVLGRHRKALRRLGRLFSTGAVEKTYWAVVEGAPQQEEGRIDLPIRKLTGRSVWRMAANPEGQPASTLYRVAGRGAGLTWLILRPLTGRTHQIRVHCAAIGCPVAGDTAYGAASGVALQLHARGIIVPLYPKRAPISALAPAPLHMMELLRACGFEEDA